MKTLKPSSSLCLISMLIMLILACCGGNDDFKREKIAVQIKSEIEYYFEQNGFYPRSLDSLPISKNADFISYYKGGVFLYTSAKGDKPWYHFIWRRDGILGTEGSDHGLSWNGMQCGNDKAHLRLLSEDAQPDANGFYDIDLH